LYSTTFSQSTQQTTELYAAVAFDNIMASVGGFSAFMWMGLALIMGGYQNFRYTNDLVEKLYVKEKRKRDQ